MAFLLFVCQLLQCNVLLLYFCYTETTSEMLTDVTESRFCNTISLSGLVISEIDLRMYMVSFPLSGCTNITIIISYSRIGLAPTYFTAVKFTLRYFFVVHLTAVYLNALQLIGDSDYCTVLNITKLGPCSELFYNFVLLQFS